MKKVLSVVLVLAMILGSFSMVFASNYSDVKDTDANSEAINVLSGLDVIGGYTDGTFKPEKTVTRAEMATMIVNALGIPVKGGAATQFSDVPASHWASGFISYAASVGFIAGYTDGTFQPEKTVSYNEAITMIVAALGYKADSLVGSYPGSFINKATSLGILDNMKTTGTIGANRGDIAQMLYDAMDCAIGYIDKDGVFQPNDGKSAGAYDTMFARLGCTGYDPDGAGAAKKGDAFVVTGEEDSDINLKPYLGACITAYANKDNEIIAIAEVKSVYIEDDYDSLTDDYNFDNATTNTVSFTNGEKDNVATAYDATAAQNADSIKLAVELSGKKVKTVYSMQMWTVSADNVADENVQDEIEDEHKLLGEKFKENDDEEIDMSAFELVGVDSIADIKDGDVVYVYSDSEGITKIEVGTEVITGTVAKISSSGKVFTIGDKTYKFSTDYVTNLNNEVSRPATTFVGTELEAKLDAKGYIYSYEEVTADSQYAVILDKGAESGRYGDTTIFVNMLLADGTEKEFEVKSSCATTTASIAAISGDLVSYKTNAKGLVTEIDKMSAVATTGGINAKGVMSNKVVKDTTVIFVYDGGDQSDADNYSVAKLAGVLDTDPVTAFGKADSKGVFEALLVSGINTASDELAALTGYKYVDDDYDYEITVMYEGAEKTLLCDVDITSKGTEATTAAATMYKFTFDANGAVTAVADVNADEVLYGAKTTVDGSIITKGSSKYTLDDDVVVYVYDDSDDEWTVGSAKSCAVREADLISIQLFDTSSSKDDIYEFVIVFKK